MKDCFLKFKRAGDHLKQLETETRTWIDSHPCAITSKPDTESGVYMTLATVDNIPLEPFAPLICDILHNLRSGLDHVAYALAQKFTVPLPPQFAGESEFPIFGDENTKGVPGSGPGLFLNAKKKIAGVDPAAQAIIESLQPYHRGGDFRSHPLYVLHELNRIDKHRILHPVVHAFKGAGLVPHKCVNVRLQSIGTPGGFIQTFAGVIERDTVIARYRLPPLDPKLEMYVHFEAPVEIAFPDGSVADGESVTDALAGIYNHIATEVVPPLETFL